MPEISEVFTERERERERERESPEKELPLDVKGGYLDFSHRTELKII